MKNSTQGTGSTSAAISKNAAIKLNLTGAAFLALSSAALAQGIAASKHNLSSTQTGVNANKTSSTAEICVFCHTPHGASATVTAPLWNKNLPATVYTNYSSGSMDATTQAPGSNSLSCLSCHDGSQAMDNVINAPGSGLGSGSIGAVGNWSGTNQSAGKLIGVANLGADLRNDHPVGMNYCGASAVLVTGSTVGCVDTDFKAPTVGGSFTWIDTGGAGKQKADLLLYPGAAGGTQTVQCATCHDPHQNSTGTFLRISNAGSNVCLACHSK